MTVTHWSPLKFSMVSDVIFNRFGSAFVLPAAEGIVEIVGTHQPQT